MASQNDSKYHQLFLMLKDADDYFPKEDRTDVLKLVKELYNEHQQYIEDNDKHGKYGISFTTIHDDSKHLDRDTVFFSSKEKRDNVFIDWTNGSYWDDIFEEELQYPKPGPNLGNLQKVFKEGGLTYKEKENG